MSREIGIEEVRQHTKKDSVWMVINNEVYDVTKFLAEHPGGEDSLLEAAGKDSTVAFEDVGHSSDARALMQEFKIGTLSKKDQQGSSSLYKLQWAGIALLGAIMLGYALKKSLS